MKMPSKTTFEQLCIRQKTGFVCDERHIVSPVDPENYDEVVFRIITKCDTNLLLLETHTGPVQQFSIDVVSLDPSDDESNESRSRGNWSFDFWNSPDTSDKNMTKKVKTNPAICDIMEGAWEEIHKCGCHGMMVVGILGPDSMPNNDCRKKYTLGQFVNHVIHSIEAHYMFHKTKLSFSPNLINTKQLQVKEDSSSYSRGFAVTLTWTLQGDIQESEEEEEPAVKVRRSSPFHVSTSPLNVGRLSSEKDHHTSISRPLTEFSKRLSSSFLDTSGNDGTPVSNQPTRTVVRTETKTVVRKEITSPNRTSSLHRAAGPEDVEMMDTADNDDDDEITFKQHSSFASEKTPNRRKSSLHRTANSAAERMVVNDDDDDDDEITFKKQDLTIGSEKRTGGRGRRSLGRNAQRNIPDQSEEEKEEDQQGSNDLNSTLNIQISETSQASVTPKSGGRGRKSVGRKSILPDWPEDQKEEVLQVFDNLNPEMSETSQIALTCKYASMQCDKELPSKLLYQWVQKKGRISNRTITSFELGEEEQKQNVLTFFHTLNKEQSESSRIAFVIKYVKAQYNLNITSKQLFSWLSDKGKKTPKRR